MSTFPGIDAVLATHLPSELRAKLRAVHIGIAGAGGLGSNCAMALVRTGIGQITLADHDTVSLSNLNRQFFFPRHLGQLKVKALESLLLELNPALSVRAFPQRLTPETVCAVFAECPLVVEAVDDPVCKQNLVEALLLAGHTVVSASGMAGWGGGPMQVRRLGALIVVGDQNRAVSPTCPPLAPRVLMAASMQADAVLEWILES